MLCCCPHSGSQVVDSWVFALLSRVKITSMLHVLFAFFKILKAISGCCPIEISKMEVEGSMWYEGLSMSCISSYSLNRT